MNFSVTLSDETKRVVGRLGLSGQAIREILDGFDELGRAPSRHLIRIGPPTDRLQYDLIVDDSSSSPRRFFFAFTVQYATDEETLILTKVEYVYEDILEP